MKGRKSTRRTYKKKNYGRRKQFIRRPLVTSGFPKRNIVKLRYSDYVTFNTTSTGIQTYSYSVNSLYDPNRTGTGHQPMYFDTYAGIYNHYRVLGSKMTVYWSIAGTTQTGTVCGVHIDDDANTFTGDAIDRLIEQNNSRYQIVVAQNASRRTISKWSMKKSIGRNDDSWSAQVGTNPADEQFFIIYASAADRTSSLGTMSANVVIEYIAEFFELQTAPQS